jgi:hypothetical protein
MGVRTAALTSAWAYDSAACKNSAAPSRHAKWIGVSSSFVQSFTICGNRSVS